MELNRPLATVTPTLDGDVLTVLASNNATFTTGQIHRILTQFSEEGIRKVLTRLVGQGVVLAERVGNAYSYRFNTEHIAAQPISALARLTSTFLDRLEAELSSWSASPRYAAMFGSAANGAMTVASDIDLFLVHDDDAPERLWGQQVADLAKNVTLWTGNDARPVEYSVSGLRAARQEPVVRDVVDSGLTVAGSRSWLLRQVSLSRQSTNE